VGRPRWSTARSPFSFADVRDGMLAVGASLIAQRHPGGRPAWRRRSARSSASWRPVPGWWSTPGSTAGKCLRPNDTVDASTFVVDDGLRAGTSCSVSRSTPRRCKLAQVSRRVSSGMPFSTRMRLSDPKRCCRIARLAPGQWTSAREPPPLRFWYSAVPQSWR
jgi:hypothetical protein